MSGPDSNDRRLLGEAIAAFRDKDIERAKRLFAVFAERRVARVKAKVANDVV